MRKKSNIKNTSEQIFRLTIIHFFWHKIDNISPPPAQGGRILFYKKFKKNMFYFSQENWTLMDPLSLLLDTLVSPLTLTILHPW